MGCSGSWPSGVVGGWEPAEVVVGGRWLAVDRGSRCPSGWCQRIPWGTPAWFVRYRNRMQIENVNGMLKSRGGLKDGWCQVLNKTGYNLGALTLAVAHNLRERKRYRHRQKQKTACQRPPANTNTVADDPPILTQATRGPP